MKKPVPQHCMLQELQRFHASAEHQAGGEDTPGGPHVPQARVDATVAHPKSSKERDPQRLTGAGSHPMLSTGLQEKNHGPARRGSNCFWADRDLPPGRTWSRGDTGRLRGQQRRHEAEHEEHEHPAAGYQKDEEVRDSVMKTEEDG